MEESDEILVAIQAIFEMVQTEFLAAATSMEPGNWEGLDSDARDRVSRKARAEVNRLRAIFDRLQAGIDAAPEATTSEQALEDAIAAEQAKLRELGESQARLDALIKSVEAQTTRVLPTE